MRLALVTQHYPPHFEGGTETVVRAQAAAFAALGHAVTVVAGSDRPHAGRDVEEARVDGLAVRLLPRLASEPYDLALERPRLRALVQDAVAESDLVHLHHWSTLDARLVRTLAPERPVAVTLHDLFVTCPRFFRSPEHGVARCGEGADLGPCAPCAGPDLPGLAPAALARALAERAAGYAAELAAAALVVAPSASHLARVRAHVPLPEGRTAIVPHGLARDFARAGESLPFGLQGTLRVGFLGHRARLKGVLDLVEALAGLEPGPRARVELVLLGDAVEPGIDERLRALAAGRLRLAFAGPYALDDLPARVRESGGLHLVAQPSRAYESYGLVVDEALALGLPAWVSDRGAPRERVGQAGLVLPAADPAAWRAAFARLLADPSLLARQRSALPARVPRARDAAAELARRFGALVEQRV